MIAFAVNTGAGNANEGTGRQIDTAGQLGVAVGAFLVGGHFLELTHNVVGRVGCLAAIGACCWAARCGGSWWL
jgi:hypothetical protein